MSETWSSPKFYNKWLRSQAELPLKSRNPMIISMHSVRALQLVLLGILKYDKHMSTTRVRVEVVCPTEIRLTVVDSREMST